MDKKSKIGGNNGRRLKVGCMFENLRPLSKPNLHLK
jgi:hypothetical protein